MCFPPVANRLQCPHNVSPSVTDVLLSRPWWEHDVICILQVFFKKCSSLQCSHHQFPSLFALSLSVLLLLYAHNRFDACLYARHGCLGDGFILWKCWGLWVKIVGSLTLWLRGTKPQESISPASCCLDTALHCLRGYFKPFKDIRVRVYVARMWTQPQRQLPMRIKSVPCWRSIPPAPHHPRWVRTRLRRDVFPRWPCSLCASWAICSACWECELLNVKSPCSLKVVQLYSHWVKQEATLAQMQRGQRSSAQNRGGQKQRSESIFLASVVNICFISFGIQLFFYLFFKLHCKYELICSWPASKTFCDCLLTVIFVLVP